MIKLLVKLLIVVYEYVCFEVFILVNLFVVLIYKLLDELNSIVWILLLIRLLFWFLMG